jgi:hypothetical protein
VDKDVDNIAQAARLMLELYGDGAGAHAAQMADVTRQDGEGTRLWFRIRRAIEFMRTDPSGIA